MGHTSGGKRGGRMNIGKKILLCIFVFGVTTFFICAGIAVTWMAIEDTALGRAIDEAVDVWIERRRHE